MRWTTATIRHYISVLCYISMNAVVLFSWQSHASAQEEAPLPLFEELLGSSPVDKPDTTDTASPEPTENASETNPSPAQEVKIWSGSLMFGAEKVQWVKEAIKAYETNIPLEILMPDLFPSQVKTKQEIPSATPLPEAVEHVDDIIQEVLEETILPTEAPVFFLNSVVYFSPQQWTIWVNDEKISVGDEHDQLEVSGVEGGKVTFFWRDSKIDYIFPKWREKFTPLLDTGYFSNQKDILINGETGDISFVLQTNQSFVSKDLKVVEGVVLASGVEKAVSEEESFSEDSLGKELLRDIEETVIGKAMNENINQGIQGLELLTQHKKQIEELRKTLDKHR